MNKAEVFEILKSINVYYHQFEVTQERIDGWYKLLRNSEFGKVIKNLDQYALENKFPPTVSDLVKKSDYTGPTVEDTQALFSKMTEWEKVAKENPGKPPGKEHMRKIIFGEGK